MSVIWLGIFLAGAFFIQAILGFMQLKRFINMFRKMNRQGKVLIGKNPKRLQAGSIILLNIDESANIKHAELLKGVTSFARFRSIDSLEGQSLPELVSSYEGLRHFNPLIRGCLLNAYRNFVNFRTGNLPENEAQVNVNFFALPVFISVKNAIMRWIGTIRSYVGRFGEMNDK